MQNTWIIVGALAVALALAGCGRKGANPATESYPAKLGKLANPEFQVRNFGVSGATLLKKGGSPYWSTTAFRPSHDWNPDIVIIKLGSNDSQPQNWRHATNFLMDYEALIASYTNLPSQPRIMLCTPCPVYGNNAININPGIVKTNIAPAVRELAGRLGHGLIDMHVAMDGHREWFPDAVHPNSRGTTVMAAVVRNAIVSKATGEPPVLLAIGRHSDSCRAELVKRLGRSRAPVNHRLAG